LLAATLLLTVAAAGDGHVPGDVAVARVLQSGEVPGAEVLAAVADLLGGTPLVTTLLVALASAFARAGRRAEALFLAAVLVVRAGNWLLKAIAESPRPDPALVRVTEDAGGHGFPSTHVLSAVLLYGAVIVLRRHLIRPRAVRRLVAAAAAAAIVVTGFGRVYTGAHWPSDVLGGYLWGTLLLLAVLWVYHRTRRRIAAVVPVRVG
jgi:undecaprenyl-diphosphatase